MRFYHPPPPPRGNKRVSVVFHLTQPPSGVERKIFELTHIMMPKMKLSQDISKWHDQQCVDWRIPDLISERNLVTVNPLLCQKHCQNLGNFPISETSQDFDSCLAKKWIICCPIRTLRLNLSSSDQSTSHRAIFKCLGKVPLLAS